MLEARRRMMRLFVQRLQTPRPATRMAIAGAALLFTGMLLSVLLYQAVNTRVASLTMPEEVTEKQIIASALAPAPVAVIRESFAPALRVAGSALTGFGRALTSSSEVFVRRVWFGAQKAADYTGESVTSAVAPLFGYVR